MISIFAAFQFLTILPPIIRRNFTPQELGRSVAFYPLVGLVLAGIFYGLQVGLATILTSHLTVVILLAVWLILTRSLHFDGFLDSCDGLFGAFSSQRRLEIMHDSRVGAFGVAGGIILLLTKYAALLSLQNSMTALILSPLLGRFMMSQAIVLYPYARTEGLGKDIKDNAGWIQLLIALLISLSIVWFAAGWHGLIISAAIILLGNLWLRFVIKRLPGLTGDIYGATCEIVEVLTLVFFTINIF